jgi:hypothetical protein
VERPFNRWLHRPSLPSIIRCRVPDSFQNQPCNIGFHYGSSFVSHWNVLTTDWPNQSGTFLVTSSWNAPHPGTHRIRSKKSPPATGTLSIIDQCSRSIALFQFQLPNGNQRRIAFQNPTGTLKSSPNILSIMAERSKIFPFSVTSSRTGNVYDPRDVPKLLTDTGLHQ